MTNTIYQIFFYLLSRPGSWASRIGRLPLCRGVSAHPSKCPGYKVPPLGLQGVWIIPSLSLIPVPLGMEVLSMAKIEVLNHLLCLKPFDCKQI